MINRLFSSQLRLNMASGVATTIINVVTMGIAYPIYLHFLGYETYGVWLVVGTVLSFAQLGDLGIGQAVMKLVAEDYGRDDIKGIQRYVTSALAMLVLSGTIVLTIILALKSQIINAFGLSGRNAETVSWLLPYMSILSIYVFTVQAVNSTLSGLGRMDLANYTLSIGRIVTVGTASVLLYKGWGIRSLLIANIISYVFVQIISLIYIRRIIPIRLMRTGNLDMDRCKRILSFGSGIMGGTLVSMLGSPFSKFMLTRYAGITTVPVFEIAFNGAMQFRNLIEAGFRAFMPELSRITANMNQKVIERIGTLNRRAFELIIFAGIPMYLTMLIFASPLLKIWLRGNFSEAIPSAFVVMLIATFVNLCSVPSYYFLMGMGRVRDVLAGRSITWFTNMGLIACVAIYTGTLSVPIMGICLCISWCFSTSYFLWRFHSVMSGHQREVDLTDRLSTGVIAN